MTASLKVDNLWDELDFGDNKINVQVENVQVELLKVNLTEGKNVQVKNIEYENIEGRNVRVENVQAVKPRMELLKVNLTEEDFDFGLDNQIKIETDNVATSFQLRQITDQVSGKGKDKIGKGPPQGIIPENNNISMDQLKKDGPQGSDSEDSQSTDKVEHVEQGNRSMTQLKSYTLEELDLDQNFERSVSGTGDETIEPPILHNTNSVTQLKNYSLEELDLDQNFDQLVPGIDNETIEAPIVYNTNSATQLKSYTLEELGLDDSMVPIINLQPSNNPSVPKIKKVKVPLVPQSDSNLLYLRFPNLFKEIHPTLNKDIDLFKITYGSGQKLYWLCIDHDTCSEHVFLTRVSDRSVNNYGCSFCAHKKICICDSLKTTHPALFEELDSELNPGVDILRVSHGCNKVLKWRCFKHTTCDKHIYKARIPNRLRGENCSFCTGKKNCDCQLMCNMYPELFKELHPTKNLEIISDLRKIYCTGFHKYWWICTKHTSCDEHVYLANWRERVRGTNCSFCVSRHGSVCRCNSLQGRFPEITAQIDRSIESQKNLDASTISYGSHFILHWICTKTSGEIHRWSSSAHARTNTLRGVGNCPYCRGSAMEKECRNILNKHSISHQCGKTFENCRSVYVLPFDVYIEKYNLLIELDGAHHFKAIEFYETDKGNFEIRKKRDMIKNQFAYNEKFNFLRISFTEAKNMESHLITFINEICNSRVPLIKFVGKEYQINNQQ